MKPLSAMVEWMAKLDQRGEIWPGNLRASRKMDDTDQRLIAELRRDGRAALSELAERLELSRAAVRSRIQRLVARGEIAGFTVLTRSDVAQAPVRGLMLIGIEGKGAERIMVRLAGIPAVVAVHSTTGKWDLIAELATQTLPDLDEVIFRIRTIEGVMTSETNPVLSTRKAGRRPGWQERDPSPIGTGGASA